MPDYIPIESHFEIADFLIESERLTKRAVKLMYSQYGGRANLGKERDRLYRALKLINKVKGGLDSIVYNENPGADIRLSEIYYSSGDQEKRDLIKKEIERDYPETYKD